MGSVKDLQVLGKTTSTQMGIGRFTFSDRYSVFDWGEMPDHIRQKGAALCVMGAYSFEQLEQRGISTHYRGIVDSKGRAVKTDELTEPSNIIEFNLVQVHHPTPIHSGQTLSYDYHMYNTELTNFLIPLEVIYRNGLPQGSSVFKRLERGQLTLEEIGLDHPPSPGERLDPPIFDVSTKLEERDRYLSWSTAQKIAGLTSSEITQIKDMLLIVDQMITELVGRMGLVNEDGKIELAMDPQRKLMIVDVVGTLDESRFTSGGVHVSKEMARQYYKTTPWYSAVEKAKQEAEANGIMDWKSLCTVPVPLLDPELKQVFENIYTATANAYTGLDLFDTPPLGEVIETYKALFQ